MKSRNFVVFGMLWYVLFCMVVEGSPTQRTRQESIENEEIKRIGRGFKYVGGGVPQTGVPMEMMTKLHIKENCQQDPPIKGVCTKTPDCRACKGRCVPHDYDCCQDEGWCRVPMGSCCKNTRWMCCLDDDRHCCLRWTYNDVPLVHDEL